MVLLLLLLLLLFCVAFVVVASSGGGWVGGCVCVRGLGLGAGEVYTHMCT